jgi:hypothetical protein
MVGMGWCRKVWILCSSTICYSPLFKKEEHAGDQLFFCWSNYSDIFHSYIERRMRVWMGRLKETKHINVMHLLGFCSVLSTRSSSYVSGQALTFLEGPGVFFFCVSEMQLSSQYTQYAPWMCRSQEFGAALGASASGETLSSGNEEFHGPYLLLP